MKTVRTCMCVLMAFFIAFSGRAEIFAETEDVVGNAIADTAQYIYGAVQNPCVGSVGGEWAVIGLAGSDLGIEREYRDNYYRAVTKYVKDRSGILHGRKYTEYSRVILALTAIGKNPADVSGYNLLVPLSDYDMVVSQGINGPVWALIALDSGNYDIPKNENVAVCATRERYVRRILELQLSDGGWSLSDGEASADPDVTAMAIQALSKYLDIEEVKSSVEKALECMSACQNENGGFSSGGTENSEVCAQMIIALSELGISPDDTRFVKNGNTLLDNLFTYYENGKGFRHTHDGESSNLMATEQAFCALDAYRRCADGKGSLYSMGAGTVSDTVGDDYGAVGLPRKHTDVKVMAVTEPGKTFDDISSSKNKKAIEALSERGIINGKSEGFFAPDDKMTRAEFAAIIVRSLGLELKENNKFTDVAENDWFYKYVGTACEYGIVGGVSENLFNPNGIITVEEAAVMTARAAGLCGMSTDIESGFARDILSGFVDYVNASDWSTASLAFCCIEGIISDDETELKPKQAVTRAEIAQMVYNMLKNAELIYE